MFVWRRRWYHRPLRFTSKIVPQETTSGIPAIRLCDEEGQAVGPLPAELQTAAQLRPIYQHMVLLATMDSILYDAQRQGRISFYMTSSGEEATHFGSAAAISPADPIYAQYRETGVLLARGFPLQQLLHQLMGNHLDWGKGRQMPVHYGSRALNIHTISSPLGTQVPHAVGAAYHSKLQTDNNTVPICYFGEGAASEGDCHVAFNMAATLKTPLIFFCRNNAFAISTPDAEQYAGDGIAARGPAYAIPTFRVDGNDLWAVFAATKTARELALRHSTPVLIEAITYRVGHHSTSDDSSAYRQLDHEDIGRKCPIARVRRFMTARGLLSAEEDDALRTQARQDVLNALSVAEKLPKPPIDDLFSDVYDQLTPELKRQKAQLLRHLERHGEHYDPAGFHPSNGSE